MSAMATPAFTLVAGVPTKAIFAALAAFTCRLDCDAILSAAVMVSVLNSRV